ncbi:hypothetical protein [Sphingopyxis kveilinensis]|uniref:hypothetical protein n=1 Tax=Sphingopyxis kveilinensis TaxID=3114367 RepID=UPI0030CE2CBE
MMSAVLMAMTPPPPIPPRPIVSRSTSCDMNAEDGARTKLAIELEAVPIMVNGREESVYRWTISGDDERYPSPQEQHLRRDYENVWLSYSTKTVTRHAMNYTYRLHYDDRNRTAPEWGYLIVERWPVGHHPVEARAIGLCKFKQSETVQ